MNQGTISKLGSYNIYQCLRDYSDTTFYSMTNNLINTKSPFIKNFTKNFGPRTFNNSY